MINNFPPKKLGNVHLTFIELLLTRFSRSFATVSKILLRKIMLRTLNETLTPEVIRV